MRSGRNLVVIGLLAGALILPATRKVEAQESPPDLRILLNLDLFKSPPPSDAQSGQGQGTGDSMLDQIRALNAMGYLGTAPHDSGPPGKQDIGGAARPSNPPSPAESSDSSETPQ